MNPSTIVVFGVSYTLVYFALAFWANSGDFPADGTQVFLGPVYGWILVLVALGQLADLTRVRNRIFFLTAMLSHYFFVAVAEIGAGDYFGTYFSQYLNNHRSFVLVVNGWYFLGQAFLWLAFVVIIEKAG
jgi:hypothetical protein